MGEPGRIQVWWSRLSRAWRVNVTLYFLACLSLFALIVQVLTEEAPRRVEVASNASRPTTTRGTRATEPPTTTAAPSAPRTTVALTPEAVPTTAPPAPSPPAADFDPSSATTLVCRNSTDPDCGPFRYDPVPSNAPLTVDVRIVSDSDTPGGRRVGFSVTVSDPDHPVSDCGVVDFGDQSGVPRPCSPDPPCPPLYGPWDPPPSRGGGSAQFSFEHDYAAQSAPYSATFIFRTEKDQCRDPYASEGSGSITFVVTPPSEGT